MRSKEEHDKQLKFGNGTQLAMIVDALEAGLFITPMYALEHFGCFRLAAQIFVLRQEGWDIETIMHHEGRKKWAVYKLISTPAATARAA